MKKAREEQSIEEQSNTVTDTGHTSASLGSELSAPGAQGSGQVSGSVVHTGSVPTDAVQPSSPAAGGAMAPLRAPQPLSVGRVVHYKLAVRDVQAIGDMRTKMMTSGNPHNEGEVYPAVIVRVWDANGHEGVGACNLKVMVDADVRDLWVTSATRGDGNGQWNWPPKV